MNILLFCSMFIVAVLGNVKVDTCSACKSATKFIGAALKYGNMSMDVIEAGARIACVAEFGNQVVPACEVVIHEIHDVILWLTNGLNEKEICEKLRLCGENTLNGAALILKKDNFKKQKDGFPDPCVYCVKIATTMENAVKNNPYALAILREGIEIMCQHESDKSTCKLILDHFDVIAKWLEDGIPPHDVCAKLYVCPAKNKKKDVLVEKCLFCEYGANYLRDEMNQIGFSRENTKLNLQELCLNVQDYIECNTFIQQYDTIVQHLKQGVSTEQLCKSVNLCPTETIHEQGKDASNEIQTEKYGAMNAEKSREFMPFLHINRFQNETIPVDEDEQNILSCALCTEVAQVLQQAEQLDESTVPLIEQAFDMLCSNLPEVFGCKQILANFDKLVADVKAGKDPNTACTDIQVCAENSDRLRGTSMTATA